MRDLEQHLYPVDEQLQPLNVPFVISSILIQLSLTGSFESECAIAQLSTLLLFMLLKMPDLFHDRLEFLRALFAYALLQYGPRIPQKGNGFGVELLLVLEPNNPGQTEQEVDDEVWRS